MRPAVRLRLALTLALATAAPAAMAQQSANDTAQRRVLMDQAQHASDTGDHARAVELAERAGQIQASPSLRLFLAQEQSRLNRIVAALGNAQLCVTDAERDPTLHNRATILSQCRALMATLRGRVALVTVNVPSPAPDGMHVTVGGTELPPTSYGVPYAVDPGQLVIEVTAPGRQAFHRTLTAAPGASSDVAVTLTAENAAVSNGTATTQPANVATSTANDGNGNGNSGSSTATTNTASAANTTSTTTGTQASSTNSNAATHEPVASTGTTTSTESTGSTGTTEPVTPLRHDEPVASGSGGGIPIPAVVIAAVGLVGGGVLAGLTWGAADSRLNSCMQDGQGVYHCPTEQRADDVRTDLLIGNIAVIGGSVLVLGGLAWIVASQLGGHSGTLSHASRVLRTRPTAGVTPLPGGGVVAVGFSL